MLKTLLREQRKYLDHFFESLDHAAAEKVLGILESCTGTVIFSGVGKSGHIAEKLAATFLSTGKRAIFLAPMNALHGDIGFVSSDDVCLFFSKSGESQELLDLVPHVKRKGASTIAIVSNSRSSLGALCDLSIELPVIRELCPHDLAPTTSTTSQLIFGDCLAVALMQKQNFSVDDFAQNHPSGLLGRKVSFTVGELMLKGDSLPLCKPTQPLLEAIPELSSKKCGCLLVVDEKMSLLGIFTDGDLRRAIQTNGAKTLLMPLSEHMTKAPKTIASAALAFEAIQSMEKDPSRLITVLPVVDLGKVVGLIRMHDILQKEIS